ncbi:hypothetical protein QOT17_007784 [Balamuthia mandrillaris]
MSHHHHSHLLQHSSSSGGGAMVSSYSPQQPQQQRITLDQDGVLQRLTEFPDHNHHSSHHQHVQQQDYSRKEKSTRDYESESAAVMIRSLRKDNSDHSVAPLSLPGVSPAAGGLPFASSTSASSALSSRLPSNNNHFASTNVPASFSYSSKMTPGPTFAMTSPPASAPSSVPSAASLYGSFRQAPPEETNASDSLFADTLPHFPSPSSQQQYAHPAPPHYSSSISSSLLSPLHHHASPHASTSASTSPSPSFFTPIPHPSASPFTPEVTNSKQQRASSPHSASSSPSASANNNNNNNKSGNYRTSEQRLKHNAIERKRKREMKIMLEQLKEMVPTSNGLKDTQLSILKNTVDHMVQLKREMEHLSRRNELLKSLLREHNIPVPFTEEAEREGEREGESEGERRRQTRMIKQEKAGEVDDEENDEKKKQKIGRTKNTNNPSFDEDDKDESNNNDKRKKERAFTYNENSAFSSRPVFHSPLSNDSHFVPSFKPGRDLQSPTDAVMLHSSFSPIDQSSSAFTYTCPPPPLHPYASPSSAVSSFQSSSASSSSFGRQ